MGRRGRGVVVVDVVVVATASLGEAFPHGPSASSSSGGGGGGEEEERIPVSPGVVLIRRPAGRRRS